MRHGVGILLNLVEPDVARTTRRSSPAAFVGTNHQTQSIMCLQGPSVQHTKISVDDLRCHQWHLRSSTLINDKPDRWSTSALETWAYQRIFVNVKTGDNFGDKYHKRVTIVTCRWHLKWKATRVFMSVTKRVHAYAPWAWQTLSVLGTGVPWCLCWKLHFHTICREFINERASPFLRSSSGRQ